MALGVKQRSGLKIERQTDLYLSTLRRFVEAAGGTLELRAELPGTGVIHLTEIGELNSLLGRGDAAFIVWTWGIALLGPAYRRHSTNALGLKKRV
jgi:hypothetical protein